jgi:hypothetical protein
MLKLTLDASNARLSISSEAGKVALSAAEVDQLIAGLKKYRALMTPSVPTDYALGQRIKCVADPHWKTELDLMLGASMVHIRDPGLGWLHFLFPKAEAARLGRLLQAQAEAPLSAHAKMRQ